MAFLRGILLGLVIISCACSTSDKEKNQTEKVVSQDAEKEKIKAFWEVYRKAQASKKSKNFEEAKTFYLEAIELDPQHEDALFNLGNMCYELRQNEEAEKAWKKLITVNSKNVRGHFQLGNLYLRPEIPEFFNLEKAKQEFKKAADLNRVVTGPLLHLGQIELITNQLDSAEFYFESVTATNEKSAEAYFQLGYLNWLNGDKEMALNNFKKANEVTIPEKAVEGVLSEGDTKGGESLIRPINESVFNEFLINLGKIDKSEMTSEMNAQYQSQQAFLKTFAQ